MKIVITADRAGDIPEDVAKKYNIKLIPIYVTLGDKEYWEDEIKPEQIYEYVTTSGVLPMTAARNSESYKEVFSELKKEYDAIIHFCLSTELSCSGINASNGAKELENVHVIDSRSLSSGIGLLAISAAEKVIEGKDVTTILNEADDEVRKVQASFIIPRFDYMRKGGRCSAIAAFGANLLKLKVNITMENGKMKVKRKYLGKLNDVIEKYITETVEEQKPDLKRCFITASSDMPQCEIAINKAKEHGFKEVIPMHAGSTICCHCGPDTLGILYLKKNI